MTTNTIGVAAPGRNLGWECPKCGRCYSPYTAMCGTCGQQFYGWPYSYGYGNGQTTWNGREWVTPTTTTASGAGSTAYQDAQNSRGGFFVSKIQAQAKTDAGRLDLGLGIEYD